MNSKNLPPSETQAPSADDFANNITGIGPTTEARLHDAGILTFAQLAAMTHDELLELAHDLPGMSAERMAKWDWPGQARKLASELAPVESQSHNFNFGNRQRYATFHVELLLDEENNVRRTRVVHVQSKREEPWAGWDERRLLDFMHHAALHPTPEETAAQPKPATIPKLEITKTEIHAADKVVSSDIIASDQDWSLQLEWMLSDATPDMITGHWLVRTLLESIGPGEEYSLPSAGPARVHLGDFIESNSNGHQYQYRHEFDFAAGQVMPGAYELAVAVTWEKQNGAPGELAGFTTGMLQVYTRA
jgi:hypothetical protein